MLDAYRCRTIHKLPDLVILLAIISDDAGYLLYLLNPIVHFLLNQSSAPSIHWDVSYAQKKVTLATMYPKEYDST